MNSGKIQWWFIDIMENRGDDLIFWDQDVLNIFFDDEYIKFSNTLITILLN